MNITEITVSYSITQSLPGYCNVKPGLTLTATIEEGEDALKVEAFLFDHAKRIVHEQADLALESTGEPAHFSPEPRYDLITTTRPHWGDLEGWAFPYECVALVPHGLREYPRGWTGTNKNRMRYRQALAVLERKAEARDLTMIDCSDGDLSRLPEMCPPEKKEETEESIET